MDRVGVLSGGDAIPVSCFVSKMDTGAVPSGASAMPSDMGQIPQGVSVFPPGGDGTETVVGVREWVVCRTKTPKVSTTGTVGVRTLPIGMRSVSYRGTRATVGRTLSSAGIAPTAGGTSGVEILAGPAGKCFPSSVIGRSVFSDQWSPVRACALPRGIEIGDFGLFMGSRRRKGSFPFFSVLHR
jgi:hypothetical protein